MPLWVTSAAASIVLVICVAIHHFFYVIPGRTNVPAADAIEPGTVLIDTKSLGSSTPEVAPALPQPTTKEAQVRSRKRPKAHTLPTLERTQPVREITTATVSVAHDVPDLKDEDTDILALPISAADVQRRQAVDTERAFRQ